MCLKYLGQPFIKALLGEIVSTPTGTHSRVLVGVHEISE